MMGRDGWLVKFYSTIISSLSDHEILILVLAQMNRSLRERNFYPLFLKGLKNIPVIKSDFRRMGKRLMHMHMIDLEPWGTESLR